VVEHGLHQVIGGAGVEQQVDLRILAVELPQHLRQARGGGGFHRTDRNCPDGWRSPRMASCASSASCSRRSV
jgi:hypothetical protein